MSNYRVRQVLALGQMPDRQLRLLVALATWMNDETLTVRLAFRVLAETMGTSADTARRARRDAREARRISYIPGQGRGHVTLWTIDAITGKRGATCAPPSEDVKGGQPAPEKGGNPADKRGAALPADQQEPERLLVPLAETPSSLSRAFGAIRSAAPDVTEREARAIIGKLQNDPHVRSPVPYLNTAIRNGDAAALVAEARDELARADEMREMEERQRRPDWCGQCDERTRLQEVIGGLLSRCPACHPLARETAP